jgi:hypothetical protein
MIPLLLLATAAGLNSPSVVDAERAYAAMAQSAGQWTAFRATAASGAVMFVPDPVNAIAWLQGKKDPAVAVKWQPSAAFVACDGEMAVTTGPWQRPTSVGYFVTIWSRAAALWRWNVDFGAALDQALPPAPQNLPVTRASCRPVRRRTPPKLPSAAKAGAGSSADHSLQWTWRIEPNGSRHLLAYLWNGRSFDTVIDRTIAVP